MEIDLDMGLMQFICTFKNAVLGDPRLILLGATIKEEASQKEDETNIALNHYSRLDNETRSSYDSIAQMMENQDMKEIMGIFAEKILMNLAYRTMDEERVIDITLDVFSIYCGTSSSCRMLGNTEIMRKLISNGLNTFQILQHPSQLKQLSQFFKIMLQLWLQDDYVATFE